MSQSSECKCTVDQEALLALLRSVSDELYSLVCDIVRLGESLSADEVDGDRSQRVRDLQSFDLLAQSALAQARLLQGIERGLGGHGVDEGKGKSISMLIGDVPFHKVRERLTSAYSGMGREQEESHWEDSGSLDWF
jgi:hypothetical protein